VVGLTTRTIEVTSHRWPGGIGLLTPTAAAPWWRTPDGQRHEFRAVVAGADPTRLEELARIHAEAIGAILRAAVAAKCSGEPTEARRLIAGASRLCHELLGPWGPRRRR
jgi:hypothetical protein